MPTTETDSRHNSQLPFDERSRKDLLRGLLDALVELSKDEDSHPKRTMSFQPAIKEVPLATPEEQRVDVKIFYRFRSQMLESEKKLHDFATKASQLGCSAGILSTGYYLRCRLVHVLSLFRENAADLAAVSSEPDYDDTSGVKEESTDSKAYLLAQRPVAAPERDRAKFPDHMAHFARELDAFRTALNEYHEFRDDSFNKAVLALKRRVEYQGSCLQEFKENDNFKAPAVQLFIYDMSVEIGTRMANIASFLPGLTDDVDAVLFSQNHSTQNLQNLVTVATFFSGVTATTLQFSFGENDTNLERAVNSFWFTSLVLSIGAGVNGLLAVTWKQSMHRSPVAHVPWWVLIWLKRSPLFFLVISIACFSFGLVLFVFSSSQNPVTIALTTAFSACSILGITGVAAWVALERWTFRHYLGARWAAGVLADWTALLDPRGALAWTRAQVKSSHMRSKGTAAALARAGTRVLGHARPRVGHDPESAVSSPTSPARRGVEGKAGTVGFGIGAELAVASKPAEDVYTPAEVDLWNDSLDYQSADAVQKQLLEDMAAAFKKTRQSIDVVKRLRPCFGGGGNGDGDGAWPSRLRSMLFSPDGRSLAVWGGTWAPWWMLLKLNEAGNDWATKVVRYHPEVEEVAWSPKGDRILLRSRKTSSLEIWNTYAICDMVFTYPDFSHIWSSAWLGDKDIVSVYDNTIVTLNLEDHRVSHHPVRGSLNIYKVAAIPNNDGSRRILCAVNDISPSPTGRSLPSNEARQQACRLMAYDLNNRRAETWLIVPYEIRDVVLSSDGRFGLISYHESTPSQLLRIDTSTPDGLRLVLSRSYKPRAPELLAGSTSSVFGGPNDEFVICAAKAGDIHIWERESGALIHHIPARSEGVHTGHRRANPTCVASSAVPGSLLLATGHRTGFVNVWGAPLSIADPEETQLSQEREQGQAGAVDSVMDTSKPRGIESG